MKNTSKKKKSKPTPPITPPLRVRIQRWLTPQPREHREALWYSDPKERDRITEFLSKPIVIWMERVLTFGFLGYCIWFNDLRLFLLSVLVFLFLTLLSEYRFVWWYLKVMVFQREFYERRRHFYRQGTLKYRFITVSGEKFRIPFKYPTGHIIWAMDQKSANKKYEKIKIEPKIELM